MTGLEIRRIRFDFDGDVPFNWNADNPAFSTYMNVVSVMAVCFEKMLVSAVREAMPRMTHTSVADEAEAFCDRRRSTPTHTASTCALWFVAIPAYRKPSTGPSARTTT